MAYLSLFFTSLGSATLLPGGSEALLIYLLHEKFNPLMLLFIATLGNTLGSFMNYILGKYASNFALSKGYIKQKHFQSASSLFAKYGTLSLLFSWLPIIGDPLTFFAGVVRYSWLKFIIIVSFAKFTRYLFIYLSFSAIV